MLAARGCRWIFLLFSLGHINESDFLPTSLERRSDCIFGPLSGQGQGLPEIFSKTTRPVLSDVVPEQIRKYIVRKYEQSSYSSNDN